MPDFYICNEHEHAKVVVSILYTSDISNWPNTTKLNTSWPIYYKYASIHIMAQPPASNTLDLEWLISDRVGINLSESVQISRIILRPNTQAMLCIAKANRSELLDRMLRLYPNATNMEFWPTNEELNPPLVRKSARINFLI
jgi:hypothetical protein